MRLSWKTNYLQNVCKILTLKMSFSIKFGNKGYGMIKIYCVVHENKLLYSWQNAGDHAGLRKQGSGVYFVWSSD